MQTRECREAGPCGDVLAGCRCHRRHFDGQSRQPPPGLWSRAAPGMSLTRLEHPQRPSLGWRAEDGRWLCQCWTREHLWVSLAPPGEGWECSPKGQAGGGSPSHMPAMQHPLLATGTSGAGGLRRELSASLAAELGLQALLISFGPAGHNPGQDIRLEFLRNRKLWIGCLAEQLPPGPSLGRSSAPANWKAEARESHCSFLQPLPPLALPLGRPGSGADGTEVLLGP